MELLNKKMEENMEMICKRIEPVSYTHLDVYKRQQQNITFEQI